MKPGEWIRVGLNRCRRALARQLRFRMVFGERHADGRYLPHTRISPSSCIEHESQLDLGDHVFIGHFNFIEASGGLVIEEGVQITNYVSVITHSTHDSVRITGRAGAAHAGARPGDRRAPVRIGDTVDVTVEVAELVPERRRARLTCTCAVGGETVLDGEALVKVPTKAEADPIAARKG